MPIQFPELPPPLVAVAACANRISLIEHPDIGQHVPTERTVDVALIDGRRYAQLIRERFANSSNVHFHIDLATIPEGQATPAPTITLEQLQERFEVLLGRTLHVNVTSRFVISAGNLPPVSLIHALSNIGMNINNVQAKLSAASVRLNDSVFTEVKWYQVSQGAMAQPDNVVELNGRLGLMPITADLLTVAIGKVTDGLRRFVVPSPPAQANRE